MKNATWFGIHPIVAVAFALLLPGCGITTVSLSDYNTSCSVDTDCMAVAVGEVCRCACCQCCDQSIGFRSLFVRFQRGTQSLFWAGMPG